LWKHNIPAIGVPGASAFKLIEAWHVESLKSIYIVQESDEAGEKFQYAVGQHLTDIGYEGEIKIVTMIDYNDPNEMYVQNVINFKRMFRQMCKKARPWTADFVEDMIRIMSDVTTGGVQFLWDPYIPKGFLTILAGQAGAGKSSLTYKLTSCMSAGISVPGVLDVDEEKKILLFSSEDHIEHVIKPRLDQNGANQSNIGAFDFENYGLSFNKQGMQIIDNILSRFRPDLVVFDPIVEFIGAKVDLFRANEIRPMLAPLRDMIKHHNIGCLIVAHIGKGSTGRKLNEIVGSQDFGAIVRSGLGVEREEDSDYGTMFHTKSNVSAKGLPVPYSIINGVFRFDGLAERKSSDTFDKVARGEDNVVEFRSPDVATETAPI
jgi:hypothetical protein